MALLLSEQLAAYFDSVLLQNWYTSSGVSGFSGMGIVEWWNSGTVEWWNGFFSRSFCVLVCVLTIVRST